MPGHRHRQGRGGGHFEVHAREEVLESIWAAREQGKTAVDEILKRTDVQNSEECLEELVEEGMVEIKGDELFLTEKGERVARKVIRQHRLAEVLLLQVMDLDDEQVEDAACRFEHVLNPEVTESICTLLGHPRTCPHGRPIPPARCCERFRTEVQPLVQRLSDLAVGQSGRISVIAPKFHSRLERLGALGVVPGAEVRLRQKFPSYVVEVGETTLAIDRDIADEILIRLTGTSSTRR